MHRIREYIVQNEGKWEWDQIELRNPALEGGFIEHSRPQVLKIKARQENYRLCIGAVQS
jgi:hypothetical protein